MVNKNIKTTEDVIDEIFEILHLMILSEFKKKEETSHEC